MPYTLLQASKLLGYKEESKKALPSYDVEKGKQGYQQYLNYLDFEKSERERKAAEVEEARKSETFWETIGRYLGSGGATDTSLSMNQGMNQAIDYYQNHYDPSSDKSRRPQDDWTDEERWAFGAKYLEDEASAFDFAAELNKQHQKKKLETWTNKKPINKVAGTVGSIGLNIVGGGVGFLDSLAQKSARGEIVNHGVLYPHEVSGTIQETVATGLNEKYGTVNFLGGERGWGDVYGLGTSVVQSMAAGALGGGGGTLVSFFGMAASQGVTDAKSRGATDEQAIGFGIVSGLAEAIPEMISVDKLFSLRKASSVKNFFRQMLSQAGEEAGEELTTSLITEVADRFIMDGKSNYNILVQRYLASGMTLKEAQNKAISDTIKGFAYDALSGFLSGGVSGGLMVGGKTLANRLDVKANARALEQLQPQQNELIEEGKKYKPTEKRAAHLEKKIAEGKEASGYELRMLASEVSKASRDADVATLRKAIVEKMKAEGLTDNQAKRLGEIALNKAIGNEVSALQNSFLKNNAAAMKVYNQMDTDNMLSGYSDSEWTKETPLAKLKAESGELQKGIEKRLNNVKTEYDQSKIVDKSGKAVFEKSSADSKLHLDGISSELTKNNVAELKAIEKLANELGVNIHVYETMLDKKGDRVYIDKDGNKITSSGYYDPKDKSIHIDLRAGNKGEGTMLYTASHELVHYMKDISKEHYDALEKLVTAELIKGGKSIEALMEAQRQKALENGQTLTDKGIREEMIADACQSFLASKSAIADIKALKTKNKSLWTALKKFFTTLFTKLNKIYKTVDPDTVEGKYIADMRNSVKNIRDAFMEGVTAASETKAQKEEAFKKSYIKSKDIRNNARYVKTHKEALENLDYKASAVSKEEILKGYDKLLEIWDSLGGEINSEFLKAWNDKSGKDRAFTVFKEQAGYKYNVELSSMCKKGIPLFEAIDYIVREEISNQLKTKTIGKAEKEILYDLLKKKGFEIPCAICYVEQARVREGEIIDSFLEGKREYNKQGVETTHKIGWNETFADLEKGMRARGVKYTFPEVSRSISTDAYSKMEVPPMDEKTQKAFYDTLLKLVNKEVERYNATKSKKAKERMPLKSITPSEIKRCLSGTLSSNLKLYKTIAMNPDSRFTIKSDLLYSSATTTNLAIAHNALYSLFNQQGGVSGYKSKQGTVVYWGDILNKKWDASKLRKEGGVRNQSNSDFMMYTLLDHAQMYMDFTAKGYYLQAYTKVLAELKLFGLSRGKINASLIPKVVVYYNTDGSVDIERTRENAGLDEKGNPIYDDIEGVNHKEAFMLLEDSEYSKSIGGICIGYSDNHIRKLLDDNRVQQIIGFHDKTDDPDKRYPGARYAKNYNGENEARKANADGTFETVHIGFNQYVLAAEKLFTKDKNGSFSGEADFNGKHYTVDDIPKLAADMYLKMCADKGYTEAYKQFSDRPNYYKLLADFSLYDSEGHYAPHQKVAYNMPDTVPYLDENGKKQYLDTKRYIKRELVKELFVRDDISAALSDHSEEGLIPSFVREVNALHEKQEGAKAVKHSGRVTSNKDTSGNELSAEQQEFFKDSVVRDSKGNLMVLYHGTTANFNEFKKGDVGFHFGTKGAARGRVGYGKNVTIKEVYLNITNPIVFDDDLGSWDADYRLTRELYDRGILTQAEAETVLLTDSKQYRRTTEAANKKLAEVLLAKGYDGIEYTNTHESKKNSTSYIIFDSNQAKLITNTNPTASKDIRYQARSTITPGVMQKTVADLSHNKVYSRKEAFTLLKDLGGGNLSAKSLDKLSEDLWIGLNKCTSAEERNSFAELMAETIVDRMLVDETQPNPEWQQASEEIAYFKSAINKLSFTDEQVTELKHILDVDGYKSLRARWGFKSRKSANGIERQIYPLDMFIADIAAEIPGMEHLGTMHPAEALVEIDKKYAELSEKLKNKYESEFSKMPDDTISFVKNSIEDVIAKSFSFLGTESKYNKVLSEKLNAAKEQIDFWKAENTRTRQYAKWSGILTTKANQIKELKKGTFYNATQHKQDLFKDSIEELSKIQWRGNLISVDKVREIFANLSQWYTKDNPMIFDKDKSANENIYDDGVATAIEFIATQKAKKLTVDEYEMIYEVMNHLYVLMRNYNKVFFQEKWQEAPDLAKSFMDIMREGKRNDGAIQRLASEYGNAFFEPMTIARMSDGYNENGFYTTMMEEFRKASINASVGEMNLRKQYDEFIDNNKKYLTDAAKETVKYRGYDVPKMHLIGLYMTMKRKHAWAGIALNGFEFQVKNKWWDSTDTVSVPGLIADGNNVTQADVEAAIQQEIGKISKEFTEVDKQYIEILEKLFNEDLRNLKANRDIERKGYTNATLDYYYPIMRAGISKTVDTSEMLDAPNRATNASFNKNTVKGARQKLVIISADAMVNKHITDVCKYAYMSPAIETYDVLTSVDIGGNPNNPDNISSFIKHNKVWEKSHEYFKKIVSDMQGIRPDRSAAEDLLESVRGSYAKFQLGLSLKVLCSQFSSVIAAGDVISMSSILSVKQYKTSAADIEKYCPLAAVRSYDKTVIKAMSVSDKVGKGTEKFTALIGCMDKFVVNRLFVACQVEAQKLGHGKIGTDANKVAAGRLLERVIIETQQNSYATERSAAMRSTSELLRTITMFTADAMKITGRVIDAYGELRALKRNGADKSAIKAARRKLARTMAVSISISAYMVGIGFLFKWIYGRDEDDENLLLTAIGDLFGNIIGALPIISDLYDYIVNGYEVETPVFDTLNNIIFSIGNISSDVGKLVTGEDVSMQKCHRDLRSMLYGVGQLLGVPFRNVYNLTYGIIDKFSPTSSYKIDNFFYESNMVTDFNEAVEDGDEGKTNYILGIIYDERVGTDVNKSVKNELIRLTKKEYKVLPKTVAGKITRNGIEYEISSKQAEKIRLEYSKVNAEIEKLIASSYYQSKTDEKKAELINYYHDYYYNAAIDKVMFNKREDKYYVVQALGMLSYTKVTYATKGITADKDSKGNTISGSKKEKIIAAVKKSSLSKEKQLLYIASLGYKLTDEESKTLCDYLNKTYKNASTRKKLAEICGFDYKNGKIVFK